MEPDLSDLSHEELNQRIAELQAKKKSLQHHHDKAVTGRRSDSGIKARASFKNLFFSIDSSLSY
jgi:uncharacterized small protein (DUF1192 family)